MATTPNAPTPGADAEFAGQLFFRLWRASHTRFAEALESLSLKPAHFALLNVLGTRKGAIQQQIGSEMGIDPSTMVSLVDDLEAAGLAKRRTHAKDRRAREVSITPKGQRTLKRAREFASRAEDEVLRGLNGAERRELLRLMRSTYSAAPEQSLWSAEEGD